MNKLLIRVVAIYLWWFIIVFILATAFGSLPFLAEGTWLGDTLIRRPYQWDFELMFTVLFLLWGVFLWRSAGNPTENKTLIQFSAWAFLTHGLTFIVIGLLKHGVLTHALVDSVWWFAAALVLFKTLNSDPK